MFVQMHVHRGVMDVLQHVLGSVRERVARAVWAYVHRVGGRAIIRVVLAPVHVLQHV